MKTFIRMIGILLLATMVAACGNANNSEPEQKFDSSREITVVSREEGSGTRGAFIELLKIEEKKADGTKVDRTTKEAIIGNKTDVILTNVTNDPYAIGYVSLGSLNDSVKALKVDGVMPTAASIIDGTYQVARPFNVAWVGEGSALAKDFMSFIMSKEGQDIVAKSYIKVDEAAPAYAGTNVEGKLVVAGSSSVTPIMEKLVEAYLLVNTKATIEVQMSDSSAGMTAAINGTADIGMASRSLKDSELAQLNSLAIAMDGIAIIVNNENPQENISAEQIKSVFVGEITTWDELAN